LKLIEAIETYIERKRSQGFEYSTTGANLLALGKFVGDIALERVTAREVSTFLDGPKLSPRTWEQRYLLLRAFFDYWLARGEIAVLPMPLTDAITHKVKQEFAAKEKGSTAKK
jgi:hypothetical protein